ncbi:MAG: T9SS type A sorting domain-containing protein [Saprospiraceae bacterium]|nr:T9SS type A sorting domain-containing protein [Saprospiraceae bacterium]
MSRIFTFLVCLFSFTALSAQSEMIIEPTDVGILNQTIFGDTTATGERMDPERVYVLRRGAPYLLSESMRWGGFHLRIKAEEGDGPRPLILFNVDAGGSTLAQLFRLDDGADFTISGLHITCRDILGNSVNRAIRLSGDKGTVRVDDCIIEEAGQSGFRLNADSVKLFVTNSIINRIGNPVNPNNGRFMDNRGHPIDSIWIENCVVYNLTSRFYRPGSGALLHNGIFNQNTVYNTGQQGMTLGEIDNVTITNNIIANQVFLGYDTSGVQYQVEIDTFDAATDAITIENNNIYVEDQIVAAIPAVNSDGDSLMALTEDALFGPTLSEALSLTASPTTNISEELAFNDPPPVPTEFINANAVDTSGADDGIDNAGPWDFSDLAPDANYSLVGAQDIDRYTEYHDFSYPESAASFTAGTAGQPLGADLSKLGTDVDEDYFITDNILYYPNPVRETLFIQNLDKAELSSISIYNLAGQLLLQRKVEAINARFELGELPSGTYVLTVLDRVGKVSSRKLIKR